jgi:hypothetical protein
MVLVAPFGHDCVVTLSGRAPYWVGYADFPYAPHSDDRSARKAWPIEPSRSAIPSRRNANGVLRLQVEPQTAHVYVDGYYVSLAGALELAAGPHRIEIKAAGYQTLRFDVDIVPNETITYQGDLQPVPYEPYTPVNAATPKTFYVIPGCYAGDRPPQKDALPKGCDITTMHSY